VVLERFAPWLARLPALAAEIARPVDVAAVGIGITMPFGDGKARIGVR